MTRWISTYREFESSSIYRKENPAETLKPEDLSLSPKREGWNFLPPSSHLPHCLLIFWGSPARRQQRSQKLLLVISVAIEAYCTAPLVLIHSGDASWVQESIT